MHDVHIHMPSQECSSRFLHFHKQYTSLLPINNIQGLDLWLCCWIVWLLGSPSKQVFELKFNFVSHQFVNVETKEDLTCPLFTFMP